MQCLCPAPTPRRSQRWEIMDAANDRQAMLEIAERIRKDGEADRQAMMALVESNRQGAA